MESLLRENDDLRKKQSYLDDIEEENLTLGQKIDVSVCLCQSKLGFLLGYWLVILFLIVHPRNRLTRVLGGRSLLVVP